jgi:hypothetical protein
MVRNEADLFARWRALRSPSAGSPGSVTPDQFNAGGMIDRATALEERFRNLRPVSSKHEKNTPSEEAGLIVDRASVKTAKSPVR